METVYKYGRYAMRFAFFVASNLYALPCYLIWMTLLLPLRYFASSLYWNIEARLFRMLESIVVSWMDSGGYKILECGEEVGLISDEEAVLLVNHQSTADTPIMMLGLYNKGLAAGKVMWIMYKLFKYTHFGAVSTHRQDFFIDQGKEIRHQQLILLKDHLQSCYLRNYRKWIVVFPEGGFLYKRLEASQKYARKNNFPVLDYATLPRCGALQTILDSVGEPYAELNQTDEDKHRENNNDSVGSNVSQGDPRRPVKWVIDVTLAYKGGEPLDMLGMCIGSNPLNDIMLHWRAFRVKEIPREEDALRDWLYQRYQEKDELLRAYYHEGIVPGVSENATLPAMRTKVPGFRNGSSYYDVHRVPGFRNGSSYYDVHRVPGFRNGSSYYDVHRVPGFRNSSSYYDVHRVPGFRNGSSYYDVHKVPGFRNGSSYYDVHRDLNWLL